MNLVQLLSNPDIFGLICSYLSYIQIIILCQIMRKKVPSFKKLVLEEFNSLGLPSDFLDQIITNGGVLSGSFILYLLLKPNISWKYEDIDVYSTIGNESIKCKSCKYKGRYSQLGEYLCRHKAEQGDFDLYPFERKIISREWFLNSVKINDISIEDISASELIETTFDFQFLKNSFDGRKLKICDFNSLITMESVYDPRTETEDDKARILFTLHNRISKYTDRGFKIIVVPKKIPLSKSEVEFCSDFYYTNPMMTDFVYKNREQYYIFTQPP